MRYWLVLLTLLSLSIIQCAESGVGTSFSNNNEDNKEDVGKESTTDTYTGDIKKIKFFDGGWYGPYPNYNIDFEMTVDDEGLVIGLLDTPECKVKGAIKASDYAALIELVETSPLKPVPVTLPVAVDRGYKYVSLFKNASTPNKIEEQKTHLVYEHPQFVDAAATTLEERIDTLVDALVAANGCSNLVIQALTIEQKQYDYTYYGVVPERPFEMDANITRDFKLELVDGEYLVNGRESKIKRFGGCSRNLVDVPLPVNLIDPMHDIEFQVNMNICLVQFMGNQGLTISTQREGNLVDTGREGCWNTVQLRNHQTFMEGFIKFVENQEEACWAY